MLQRKLLTVGVLISSIVLATSAFAQSSGGSAPAPQPGGDTSTTTSAPQQPGQTQTDQSSQGGQPQAPAPQDPQPSQPGQDSSQQPH
jgi:hypothetical protein